MVGCSGSRCLVGGLAICCEAGQRCQDGKCVCDEPKCAARKGCCKDDRCVRGDRPEACGEDGKACKACPTGLDCDVGSICRCLQGGNDRCAVCCSRDQTTCKPGTSPTACGNHGERCQDCRRRGPGWTCKNRTCRQTGCSTPGSAPCPLGTCCDPVSKTCQPGTTNQACHAGFGVCEACGSGEVCTRRDPHNPYHQCCPTSQACPTQCCEDPEERCCFDEAGADLCCHVNWKCCPARYAGEAPTCCAIELGDSPEDLVCCPLGSRSRCCYVGQSCCPAESARDCCDTASFPACCNGF